MFFPSEWSVSSFLAAYITVPIFLALYIGHKIYLAIAGGERGVKGWKSFSRFVRPIPEVDVISGKREMDQLEAIDEERVPRNWLEKAWFWLA